MKELESFLVNELRKAIKETKKDVERQNKRVSVMSDFLDSPALSGGVFSFHINIRNLWEDNGGKSLYYKGCGTLKGVMRAALRRYLEINDGRFDLESALKNPFHSQNLPGEGQVNVGAKIGGVALFDLPKDLCKKILAESK